MANLLATIQNIDNQTLTYAPAVLAGVQVAETTGASGQSKLQSVVNGILAGTQIAESAPNPTVAGIAALANLFVSILNSTGVFRHSTSTAAAPATQAAPSAPIAVTGIANGNVQLGTISGASQQTTATAVQVGQNAASPNQNAGN